MKFKAQVEVVGDADGQAVTEYIAAERLTLGGLVDAVMEQINSQFASNNGVASLTILISKVPDGQA